MTAASPVAATVEPNKLGYVDKLHALNAMGLAFRDYRVLLYLVQHTLRRNPDVCDHSREAIAKECACSPATVSAAARSLRERGVITTYTLHDHCGRITGQAYRLHWDRILVFRKLRVENGPPLPLFDQIEKTEEPTRTSAVPGKTTANTEASGARDAAPGMDPNGGEELARPAEEGTHGPESAALARMGAARRGSALGTMSADVASSPPSSLGEFGIRNLEFGMGSARPDASPGNTTPAKDPSQNPKSKIQNPPVLPLVVRPGSLTADAPPGNGVPEPPRTGSEDSRQPTLSRGAAMLGPTSTSLPVVPSSGDDADAAALVRAWEVARHGASIGSAGEKDLRYAAEILARIPLAVALDLVPGVTRAIRAAEFPCKWFTGSRQFWNAAIGKWENQAKPPPLPFQIPNSKCQTPPPGIHWGEQIRERLRQRAKEAGK